MENENNKKNEKQFEEVLRKLFQEEDSEKEKEKTIDEDIKSFAMIMRKFYIAFIEVGFNSKEALVLTCNAMQMAQNNNNGKE